MFAIRSGIALSIVFAAVPAALLLASAPAAAKHGVRDVEAGPIWNQMDADRKCPKVARDVGGTWTGQWHTTQPGRMSVCEVAGGHHSGGGKHDKWVEAGPIWNQFDADRKCPDVARKAGGKWTGQWKTTQPGRMSVCEVKR
jgi:rubredoxin